MQKQKQKRLAERDMHTFLGAMEIKRKKKRVHVPDPKKLKKLKKLDPEDKDTTEV